MNNIAYQISELKRAMMNIRVDLKSFEKTYRFSSDDFYSRFNGGDIEDTEDFILWAGLYEMLVENENRMKALS